MRLQSVRAKPFQFSWNFPRRLHIRPNHNVLLLKGGQEFFPVLIRAIDCAKSEVYLETYWFEFSGQVLDVAQALVRAAERGVCVRVVVDGIGTPSLPLDWRQRFSYAGVELKVYRPKTLLTWFRPAQWQRLHRKLCVIDASLAFCGGINLVDDFFDPVQGQLKLPRLDFAFAYTGSSVQIIHQSMLLLWRGFLPKFSFLLDVATSQTKSYESDLPTDVYWLHAFQDLPLLHPWVSSVRAVCLLKDGLWHHAQIEKAYLKAIGRAKKQIFLMHAYFIPSRRLKRALKEAVRRGVQVTLLVPGQYEGFMHYHAARPLFLELLQAGIQMYEYHASSLYAKVAVIDAYWATVGSSNLDPLSLLLAKEANCMVETATLARQLQHEIEAAIHLGGVAIQLVDLLKRSWRKRFFDQVAYRLMRLSLFLFGHRY